MPSDISSIIRRAYREAIALAFVITVGAVWVLSVFGVDPQPTLGGVQQAMVDSVFFVFVLASAFLVFGERTIRSAVSLYKDLRGGP